MENGIWVAADRVDNSKGYPGNTVPSCWRHNTLRGDKLTFEEMKFVAANTVFFKSCGNNPTSPGGSLTPQFEKRV